MPKNLPIEFIGRDLKKWLKKFCFGVLLYFAQYPPKLNSNIEGCSDRCKSCTISYQFTCNFYVQGALSGETHTLVGFDFQSFLMLPRPRCSANLPDLQLLSPAVRQWKSRSSSIKARVRPDGTPCTCSYFDLQSWSKVYRCSIIGRKVKDVLFLTSTFRYFMTLGVLPD